MTQDERIVLATVTEASKELKYDRDGNEVEQWAVRLDVPSISKFPSPVKVPGHKAATILKGSTHRVKLIRGRLRDTAKSDQHDYDYYWDLAENGWDTDNAPTVVTPLVTPRVDDERFRTKEELRWTEAIHVASRLLAPHQPTAAVVRETAEGIYAMLVAGPTEEPTEPRQPHPPSARLAPPPEPDTETRPPMVMRNGQPRCPRHPNMAVTQDAEGIWHHSTIDGKQSGPESGLCQWAYPGALQLVAQAIERGAPERTIYCPDCDHEATFYWNAPRGVGSNGWWSHRVGNTWHNLKEQ